jgi:type IV secretory pathway VirB2 component (pilin)
MKPLAIISFAVSLLLLPAFVEAAPGNGAGTAEEIQKQANFCDGTYALCIKAVCAGIPTLGSATTSSTARYVPAMWSKVSRWARGRARTARR